MTILIALIVAYIAYRQWRTADQRLRLDLFDRRYKVYLDIESNFIRISGSGKVEDGQAAQFYDSVQVARWLFDDSIYKYIINEILGRMHEIKNLDDALPETSREDGSRRSNLEAQQKLRTELRSKRESLDKMLKPYLSIAKHTII